LLPVRTILGVVAIFFLWGFPPPFACQKSSRLAVAEPPADTGSLSYLALGDSYTIGESVSPSVRYPAQVSKAICPSCNTPDIIAATGWTTADLFNALLAESHPTYQLVTLLIGVNNQYQGRSQAEYEIQFTTLLKEAITLTGGRPDHVLVLSIPDYSVTPFGRSTGAGAAIAAQIDSFNVINYRVSQAYKAGYLDITPDSRMAAADVTLVAADGLHFSGKEYAVWARRMLPLIKGMRK
jgi:lysophospholipase L1-like esterase